MEKTKKGIKCKMMLENEILKNAEVARKMRLEIDEKEKELNEIRKKILESMLVLGKRKIKNKKITIELKNNCYQPVNILDFDKVPDIFKKITIDKNELRKILQNGNDIPGASLTGNDKMIRIADIKIKGDKK
jgi:hypothetical protein